MEVMEFLNLNTNNIAYCVVNDDDVVNINGYVLCWDNKELAESYIKKIKQNKEIRL